MKTIVKKMILMLLVATVTVTVSVPTYASTADATNDIDYAFTNEEINSLENGELQNMVLVNRFIEKIDDNLYAVIEDYMGEPSKTRSAYKTVNSQRTYTVKNANTGSVQVKFVLLAKFKYNGKNSACTDAYVKSTNYNYARYSILSDSSAKSGISAYGYCRARNKNTGKEFGRTLIIRVSANGTVSKPAA